MKKVKKGTYGYIQDQKKRKLLITILLFVLPLGLYFIGLITTKTNLNLFTFVAIMGCLPACRMLVALIVILKQKPAQASVIREAQEAAGDLTAAYELVFTTYEHISPVDALIICGNQVVGYTPDDKTVPADLQKHLKECLKNDGYSGMDVKIFKDFKAYIQRVTQICATRSITARGFPFRRIHVFQAIPVTNW